MNGSGVSEYRFAVWRVDDEMACRVRTVKPAGRGRGAGGKPGGGSLKLTESNPRV